MSQANERLIAMTDLETSGDVPAIHDILEIGLVLFNQKYFEIVDTLDLKVRPRHIETAVPAALEWNGYKPENWLDAVGLEEAMRLYAEKTQDAIFCSYNVSFDWMFINQAFHETGIENPMSTFENHDRLDVLTLAWSKGLKGGPSLSLKEACRLFDIPPEPFPHNALSGAMTTYKLWKKLC